MANAVLGFDMLMVALLVGAFQTSFVFLPASATGAPVAYGTFEFWSNMVTALADPGL